MPECPITQTQLTKENITDFVLIRSLDAYYVINKAECKEFFLLDRCPMNRNNKNYLIFDLSIACKTEKLVNILLNCEEKSDFQNLISEIFKEHYKDRAELVSVESEKRIKSLELFFHREKIISKIESAQESDKKLLEEELSEVDKKLLGIVTTQEEVKLIFKKYINKLLPIDEAVLCDRHELVTNLLERNNQVSRASKHSAIIGIGDFKLNGFLRRMIDRYNISALRTKYDMQFKIISTKFVEYISRRQEQRIDPSSCLANINLVAASLDSSLTTNTPEMATKTLEALSIKQFSPMNIASAFRRQGFNVTLRKTDKGISLNLQEELGDLCILRYMKGEDYESVINLLESKRGNPYAFNSRGETVLSLALKQKHFKIATYIFKKYDLSKFPQEQTLLDKILFFAVPNSANHIAKSIFNLKHAAGLNQYSIDYNKKNILAIAVENNNKEFFDFLIENKFNIDAPVCNSARVIHLCVVQNNKEMLLELIKREADPYTITDTGRSILYFAIKNNNVEILNIVLTYLKDNMWLLQNIRKIKFRELLTPCYEGILRVIITSKLASSKILSENQINDIQNFLRHNKENENRNTNSIGQQDSELNVGLFNRKRITSPKEEIDTQKKHKSTQPGI